MHIAVLGAGALGSVYAASLGTGFDKVSLVVRPSHLSDPPLRIEPVGRPPSSRIELAPLRAQSVPLAADLVLLAVRVEQLDASIQALLDQVPELPVVCLTPLFPSDLARLSGWLGPRLVVSLPSVGAYRTEAGVVRYWLAPYPPTLLDETGKAYSAVRQLQGALEARGLSCRFAPRVAETNLATTIAFLPLVLLLHASGGSVPQMFDHPRRVQLAIDALKECQALARVIGPLPFGLGLLSLAAGPSRLRMGFALLGRLQPELVGFFEQHFGQKTLQQNLLLGQQTLALGSQHGLSLRAFAALLAQCDKTHGRS